MICRMWRGWTQKHNADAYESYLKDELFPRLNKDLNDCGYRGFHVLRLDREDEVEFVTLVWFDSRAAVRNFAGESYELPVISPKARGLLSRHSDHCDHYDLSGFKWPLEPPSGQT
jgi:heme-degrading monooxygenase HmoA